MKEVEVLVQVFDDKKSVLTKLKKFQFQGIQSVVDIYYYDPKRPDLQPDKSGNLKRCFRLRQKNNSSYLAYKVDNFDNHGQWIYSDEHETIVDSHEELIKIINLLGFEELIRVENEKHTFISENYEIVLEDVKDLGLYMEVERKKLPDFCNIQDIKKEIWAFIDDLDIKISGESNIGKPELMLRHKKPYYRALL